jgi:sugar lactone lactonase YvrE
MLITVKRFSRGAVRAEGARALQGQRRLGGSPQPAICFGGPKRNRLFMAASQSLYAVYTATQGARAGLKHNP